MYRIGIKQRAAYLAALLTQVCNFANEWLIDGLLLVCLAALAWLWLSIA